MCERTYDKSRVLLSQSEFIHIDESSFKINGKMGYAYVVATKEIT